MNHEQQLEHLTSQSQQGTTPEASPVIAWEQRQESKPASSSSTVISIDTYRRQDTTTIDTEATVTVREFPTIHNEEPVRLLIVSSGFGQKHAMPANTVQCKAA
ncbi:hypothetical protein A8709_11150 [Paenibacillus pectinilyticus]|uniref:Uncharacterized protein n=1 Tax=Paenibacillus pectinilyticus TaxID=512399 RepID=A0A1C1A2I6_9BACL|nr:hypothetical protein [Paenibacillus pectinilyticus]OCT14731.1 hypothetical protein A8709_11150 [Paenibacillus pectinilyticus]